MTEYESISELLKKIKLELDDSNSKKIKVSTLYAFNSSGKTMLATEFYRKYENKSLCYNAYLEDLFHWDNDDCVLKIDSNKDIFRAIQNQGLNLQVVNNFKEFTNSKIEPDFNFVDEKITFRVPGGTKNIKISRGEESIFIWSVFYTVLESVIDTLNQKPRLRTTRDFDNIQYIVIDDPVSSMDDTRIITIALALIEIIAKCNKPLKFLITTHHALFFNVLFFACEHNWKRRNYILSKSDGKIFLEAKSANSLFAYHHMIINEIYKAIDSDINRHHFNLFRVLLEKTANFLKYNHWKDLFSKEEQSKTLAKLIDYYSHSDLSDLESGVLPEEYKTEFKAAFELFMEKFHWAQKK